MKYADLKTKKERIAYIKKQLASNPKWATRGLIRIFENQTTDEQTMEATVIHNGIGFNGPDAEILSSFAKQIKNGRTLSHKQMSILFRKIPKYARQLETVSH